MTPEVIEGGKIFLSGITTLALVSVACYITWQFLTLCENVALIKRKLCDGENKL